MENVLIKLKEILNTYKDKELKEIELWIDNSKSIEVIAIDENAISLITDSKLLKIDEKEKREKMINNLKLIEKVKEQIKNTTKEQLQEAIKLINKEEREEK